MDLKIYDLAIKMYNRKNLKKIVLINKSSKIDYYVPSVKKLKDTFKIKEKMTLKKSINLLFNR